MSETTPVHTGTDRVELTDADKDALCEWSDRFAREVVADDAWPQLVAAVESIVAARVQALTAERDQWKFRAEIRSDLAPMMAEERDAARVELAALVTALGFDTRDPMIGRTHAERATEMVKRYDDLAAELAAANARCAELEAKWLASDQRAERNGAAADALQATLDRVTALADEWEAAEVGVPSPDTALSGNECAADLRAALTPEGKP